MRLTTTLPASTHQTPMKAESEPYLVCLFPVQAQPSPVLLREGELWLGREPSSQPCLQFNDDHASRQHAKLSRSGGVVTLTDELSRNGTFVNTDKLLGSRPLEGGDILRLGNSLFLFVWLDDIGRQQVESGATIPPGQLELVARSPLSVMLLGATGVGKEVTASAIHRASGRSGDLVAVNCSAIPRDLAESSLFGHTRGAFTGAVRDQEGWIRQAHRGTLLLDELVELPLDLQAKFLRVLESKTVIPVGGIEPIAIDVRVISATNGNPQALVGAGLFRADLYSRLSGYVLQIPPLSRRKHEILPLLYRFLRELPGALPELSVGFVELLLRYDWPLNVRELRHFAQRLRDLPDAQVGSSRFAELVNQTNESLVQAEKAPTGTRAALAKRPARDELVALLIEHTGNVQALARHYQREGRQIYRWLHHHGLDPATYRSPGGGSANDE